MLLEEPPRTQGDVTFSLAGIPVRVHPLFWLVAVVLGLSATRGEPFAVLVWVVAVFVSIVVHELGHAVVARSYGFAPRITLYAMGGLASYQSNRRDAKTQIAISLAGPVAGFLLAVLVAVAVKATDRDVMFVWGLDPIVRFGFDPFEHWALTDFVHYMLYINIYWGLLNLLPIYPLDGGQVARAALTAADPQGGLWRSLWLSIFVAGGFAVYSLMHGDTYLTLLFAYMGYMSFAQLQAYGQGGGWR